MKRRKVWLLAIVVLLGVGIGVFFNQGPEGVYLDEAFGVDVVHDILPYDYQGRSGIERRIGCVVIHETANEDFGSDATAHNQYLHSKEQKSVKLSWHYTVDDGVIYHHIPDDEIAWHAGDALGNRRGIGVEICVNRDGDYDKALENGAKLVASLLLIYDLDIEDVKQHYDFSGKDCPHRLREEENWQKFVAMIENYL